MTQLNNQVIQDILEALTVNLKLSKDLLGLLENENKALSSMNTQELLRISKQKNALLAKIQFLDNSLKNHIADNSLSTPTDPCAAVGSEPLETPEELNLSGLILLMPQDKADAAAVCKEKLQKIRKDILVKNYINKKFTEDTLGCLGEAIALFTQPASPNNTYNAYGVGRPPQNSSSLPQLISRGV